MTDSPGIGRVAFVTGGGGGIGNAICRFLAADGASVVAADLDLAAATATAAVIGEQAAAVAIDVTDAASVQTAVARATELFGAIDICVNCAGWETAMPFRDTDDAFVTRILDLNLIGAMRVTRAVLGGMLDRQWGRIVNIASEAGRIGAPRSASYAAAKGGLIAFTKSIAGEVAKSSITANCVAPGPIDTPLMLASQGEYADKVQRFLERAIPIGRIGTADEVAAAVAFFASDGARYITGQTLSVSGGLTML
jgi:2-hydroxycyclohexanecarboxyl-CoA dehydrogenase